MEYWGYHLILNCRKGNENVRNKEEITNFINRLVKDIDMVAYGEPQVVHFAEHKADLAGFTAVQLIETSSITIHFVDQSRDFYVDVFSCKSFSNDTVLELINEVFEPENVDITFLTRQA